MTDLHLSCAWELTMAGVSEDLQCANYAMIAAAT